MSGLHVLVGATGGTGSALVRELVRRGHRVRAVSRRGGPAPDGVEVVTGDAADAVRMREVCAGATAVYNAVNPPFDRWTTVSPDAVRGTVQGAAAAGLVFADDTWMYGRVDAPMTESTPVRPVCPKGVLRAWLARAPLVRIGSRAGRALGLVWPLAREGAELVYQFEMPFVVNGSAFAARFGSTPTSYAEGIDRTLASYRVAAAGGRAA